MTFPTDLKRLKHAGWPAHASAEVLRNHAPAILELIRAAEMCAEIQDEPCRWDHDGYCQSHNLDHQMDGCRVALLKDALAKLNGGKG